MRYLAPASRLALLQGMLLDQVQMVLLALTAAVVQWERLRLKLPTVEARVMAQEMGTQSNQLFS
jgi:hypothetical protein